MNKIKNNCIKFHRKGTKVNNNRNYKFYSNSVDFIVNNQNLIHFENLLVTRLNAIKLEYNGKKYKLSLSTAITIMLTILGFSSDTIGIKLINSLHTNIGTAVESLVLVLVPIVLLVNTIRIYKIVQSLNLEFLKDPLSQEKLLYKFILQKHAKELEVDPNNIEFLHYYYNNKSYIKFLKYDFNSYVNEYLEKKFGNIIDIDIGRYLSEIIILRKLLKGEINKFKNDDESLKIIISKSNIVQIQLCRDNQLN